MLVNTRRDTDIVSVSNRTEPEEEKESWTRGKALERNKKKLQEKKRRDGDGISGHRRYSARKDFIHATKDRKKSGY